MYLFRMFPRTKVLIVLGLALVATSARGFADTYELKTVAYNQNESFAWGDDQGDYTLNISDRLLQQPNFDCGGVKNAGQCFETFYADGRSPVLTTSTPEPGTEIHMANSGACGGGAGFSLSGTLCNNGHLLVAGEYYGADGSALRGLWSGLDPLDFLGAGSIDGGFMTANGNAFLVDGLHDTLDVALDLSTSPVPEPGSLMLVGTGALCTLTAVRRRRQMRQGATVRSACTSM